MNPQRLTAVILLCCSFTFGCGGYPEVSPKAYQIATAMNSICERQDAKRLEQVSKLVEEAETSGEITSTEAGYFRDMIDKANDGDWDDARADARQMLQDRTDE